MIPSFLNNKLYISLIIFSVFYWCVSCYGQETDPKKLQFMRTNPRLNSVTPVPREELLEELQSFTHFEENIRRGFQGYELFREAGYNPRDIIIQPVSYSLDPNIIVTKKGQLDDTVIIGAHYDVAGKGSQGIVDNATGIVEVTNLAEVFREVETRFTYQFVLFGDEEIGLFGSEEFMHRLSPEQRKKIRFMINIDSIGGNKTGYCGSVSDDRLKQILINEAKTLGISLGPCSLFPECNSDHNNFKKFGIPVIFISSVKLDRIHTYYDNFSHVQINEIEKVHRLLIEFLKSLDSSLIPTNTESE